MKCTLTDDELIKACTEWVYKLCQSKGNAWTLQVPVNYNTDPDMLFTEIISRFNNKNRIINHINQISHV